MDGIKKAIYDFILNDAAIRAIVGTRVKPQLISMGQQPPYIIFERDAIEQVRHMSGVSNLASDSFTFVAFADTQELVETLKEAINAAFEGMERVTFNSRNLIIAEATGESDDLDIRGAGDQEPAYSEVITYTIWYS